MYGVQLANVKKVAFHVLHHVTQDFTGEHWKRHIDVAVICITKKYNVF